MDEEDVSAEKVPGVPLQQSCLMSQDPLLLSLRLILMKA